MFSKSALRSIYESKGPTGFVHALWNMMGIAGKDGSFYRDSFGNRIRKDAKAKPEEVNLRVLAEAIIGDDWANELHSGRLVNNVKYLGQVEKQYGKGNERAILEAGPGVNVTSFLNVNTYSLTTGGLVEAKILEAYENPAFVVSPLMDTMPTRNNGEKIIGTSTIGDKAEVRPPGTPHKRVGFGERWVETPETRELGLAIEVDKETVFFDRTNQIMERAESIGFQLGFRREIEAIDTIAGLTSSTDCQDYVYNGTTFETYQAATPWINDHVNALVDETDIENALVLFSDMTDQENSQPIMAIPDTLLTVPSLELTSRAILTATEVETRTDSLAKIRRGLNNYSSRFQIVVSQLLYSRLTSSVNGGGGLSAANAKRWWVGNFRKGFIYMQNFPLNVTRVNPSEYEMVDRGIIFAAFANERGTIAVKEPRQVVRNKVV